MRIPRSLGALGLTLLLAAWLAAAAGVRQSPVPANVRTAAAVAPPGPDLLVLEVQAQADRLADRLRTAPAPAEPVRNPFTFEAPPRTPGADGRVDRPAAEPVREPEIARPSVQLIGIAEEQLDASVIRTAVLSGPGGPYLVKEGEALVDGYRVTRIGPDVIELVEGTSGTVLILTLQ